VPAAEADVLPAEQLVDDLGRLIEPFMPDPADGPAAADDVLIQVLPGAAAQPEPAI
jgi:hypothetical protein